ncbi:STAS domain-containing protein [Streptomyces sp. NPDC001910]|uniref:STAS domain-containing protein n=1 Tax=Streptomyces sp. NPDC001910 TaxID=3154403 RepID=UPI00332F0B02
MQKPGGDADSPLHIVDARFPHAYVLTLHGCTDNSTSDLLDGAFTDVAAAAGAGALVVDLGGLEFGDETLLGLLLNARKTRDVHLVGPLSPTFQRRLDTTDTTRVFTIHPTLTHALTALAP